MAYNYGYPINYPQYTTPQYQQQNSSIIWVSGEAGAKAYLVAPNNTVQLWDSESQVIYLKSADASGMPSMKVLDYTIRGSATPSDGVVLNGGNDSPYASKAALSEVQDEIETLRAEVEKLSARRRRREESADNE